MWIDVPAWDDAAAAVRIERYGIHERAAADRARRNPVPKVHVCRGHVFVVLPTPERGRLPPTSAAELSDAVVTALIGRMRDLLSALTEEVWQLERQVTAGLGRDPAARAGGRRSVVR